jgi:hypothetical protein
VHAALVIDVRLCNVCALSTDTTRTTFVCAHRMLQVQKLGVAVLEHPSLSHIRLRGSPVTGAALLNVAAAVASGALTELALTSSEVSHSSAVLLL